MRIRRIMAIPLSTLASVIMLACVVAPAAGAQSNTYMLVDQANGLCLNGYIGSAHAEVTLQTCNHADNHFAWYVAENGIWTLQATTSGNFYCLNGYIGSAHAEVTLTPPASNGDCPADAHVQWSPLYIGTDTNPNSYGYGDPVYSLEDQANNYCLNGTISLVYLTGPPCDGDSHVEWALRPY
jgi:hypothetical protein